ncbi:microcephalin-like [Littorina saxatilis]|uniref:BRCT domain-containing protein n=1 Tax=Littorina saxatilis TaxID=31220 RepID=A0AAN9B677_9CAEN
MAEASPSTSTSATSSTFSPAQASILKDVVAYVEVRTASDDRSAAVAQVLRKMGARVEEKFTNNVTHVVFKEGTKRTRDKALKLGVHLVSVLWVESCKELQSKAPESRFVANTERCGTPPPGVRWKKYKFMQPRAFEDDLGRSAERCEKRLRKMLMQGADSNTPLHSPSHVLVVDTQPRSPFVMAALGPGFNFESPVIIPSTPPSMQARLDQLKREKEAKKQWVITESPLCAKAVEEEPLQRILFTNQTPPQEKETVPKPKPNRRSTRLSGRVDIRTLPSCVTKQRSSQETTPARTVTTIEESASSVKASSSSESSESDVRVKEQRVSQNGPKTSTLPDKPLTGASVFLKKTNNRRSLGSLSFSQDEKRSSQVSQQASNKARAHTRRSMGSSLLPTKTNSLVPPSGLDDGKEKKDREEENSSSADENRGSDIASSRQTHKKRSASEYTGSNSSVAESSSQPSRVENFASRAATARPTAKKRKLLNPSQDLHILSPSPEENPNLPGPLPASDGVGKRGKKRTSCNVDAVFPSTAPASKRSSKENHGKRKRQSNDMDANISEEGLSETGSRKTAKKSRKESHRKIKDMSASASALCSSTSHTSSMLGSSMSMIFNDTSGLSSGAGRFAPPRNSIAEFKVRKPSRQSRRKRSREGKDQGGSSEDDQRPKLMSMQKFRLSSMPSLVMTSLHRPEQEEVIAAVKKLGVFRVEDRVSKDTTHLVYGEPKRTLNVLHALARGCWLVSKEWVLESVEQKQWISEEDFEAVEEFCKAKDARLAREADIPGTYQCRIFEAAGSLFVSNTCTPPRSHLLKLLHLCGAKVTDSIQKADFYIGDQIHDEKISIKPVWVLDCISQQKLLPMDDYVLAINFKPKTSCSPEY